MCSLSNKENFLLALRGKDTQRIPWFPFVGVHAAKVIGVELEKFLLDTKLIAKGVVESALLYKADAIPLCFDLQIEAQLLGAKVKYLPKMPPCILKHPLADGADITSLPEYNPNSGRLKLVLDAIEPIKKELGEDTALVALLTGVLTLAYQLRGRRLLDDIDSKSKKLLPLLEFCKEIQLQTIKAYIARGVDALAVVEPLCHNLDKKFFIEHLSPLENELFDYIKESGLPSSFFLCGDLNELLGEICKTHCDNISVCSNVDLAELKAKALSANKSFSGNINPRETILNGSVEACEAKAKECMQIGGQKGYILSSGCDLAFDSPSENLVAIANLSTGGF